MEEQLKQKKVLIAKSVARRWILSKTAPEYRLKVFYGSENIYGLPPLLRAFRDGKVKVGSMQPIPDLGVQESIDSFTIWSSNHDGIVELKGWLEKHGFETTGVW